MYSKNKGITTELSTLTPPPGYDGSRFRRRSDGRDDTFPLYEENNGRDPRGAPRRGEAKPSGDSRRGNRGDRGEVCKRDEREERNECDECSDCNICSDCDCDDDICSTQDEGNAACKAKSDEKADCCQKHSASLLAPLLKNIGREELLIIAVILILAGEKDFPDTDTILILALLLCAR